LFSFVEIPNGDLIPTETYRSKNDKMLIGFYKGIKAMRFIHSSGVEAAQIKIKESTTSTICVFLDTIDLLRNRKKPPQPPLGKGGR